MKYATKLKSNGEDEFAVLVKKGILLDRVKSKRTGKSIPHIKVVDVHEYLTFLYRSRSYSTPAPPAPLNPQSLDE